MLQQETKDAIAKLLDLKKQYKLLAGVDWKPQANQAPSQPATTNNTTSSSDSLSAEIAAQGDLVRTLKGKDAKSVI